MKNCITCSLLLFVALEGNAQGGPWNNPLRMAWSSDGAAFNASTIFQDSSGVPSALTWKGDTLVCAFQWFRQPMGSATWDRVAVKFSFDNGIHWTAPTPIVINGFPVNYQRPFDPTLAVTAGDSIRIYFSSSVGTSVPCPYSAISADGIHYTFEPDPRVQHPTNRVIDPAVIQFNGDWHYCAPIGAPQEGAYHYTSPDGLTFSQESNFPSDNMHNWTGNYVQSNSELRFYGSGSRIWYSTSSDGFSWSGYMSTNVLGGDPTVVKLSSTSFFMIYVGPPYTTGSSEERGMPVEFKLYQNFPNPFNPVTTISYVIPHSGHVSLRVHDILGREIASLADGVVEAGRYDVSWDAAGFAGGIYMCRLTGYGVVTTTKMLLVK